MEPNSILGLEWTQYEIRLILDVWQTSSKSAFCSLTLILTLGTFMLHVCACVTQFQVRRASSMVFIDNNRKCNMHYKLVDAFIVKINCMHHHFDFSFPDSGFVWLFFVNVTTSLLILWEEE